MSLRKRLTSSFRARLLWGILLLNLAVLAATLLAAWAEQQRRVQEERLRTQEQMVASLLRLFGQGRDLGEVAVRRLLEFPSWEHMLRDAMIVDEVLLEDRTTEVVVVNPMGSLHRDPGRVRTEEVIAGITRAMRTQQPVPVGEGLCVPILSEGRTIGGGWFVLPWSPPPRPAFLLGAVVVSLLAATAAFAVVAYVSFSRSLLRPIEQLAAAARAVAEGDYSVRVGAGPAGSEVQELVEVFNGMTARVAGQEAELRRAVEEATAEARRRERALILSSRLASMGALAAGIAHEINNPLGGMLNAVRRLRAGRPEGRDAEYLDLVLEGLERMERTVRRVLDFSPRRFSPVAFSLASAVERARALVEHRMQGEGVAMEVRGGEGLPDVDGDPHEIQQVFLNLFLNSLEAIRDRDGAPRDPGRIRVTLTPRREAGRTWVEAMVEDNGRGIEEADLPRVFDPFFSTKRSPSSTGLGMFISYAILRNHGGSIEVHGRKGEGFRAVLSLPAAGQGVPPDG